MSKEFAMLTATRRLERYLSRERYNLRRMQENPKVTHSLLQAKVDNYNELVKAINDLFGALTDSSDALFDYYELEFEDFSVDLSPSQDDDDDDEYDSSVVRNVSEREDVSYEDDDDLDKEEKEGPVYESRRQPDVRLEKEDEEDGAYLGFEENVEDDEDDKDIPQWKREGYESYHDWLVDKESESAETPDDLSVGLNVSLSRHRAEQALTEYERTSSHDIANYNPEDDKPISVLPDELDEDESIRPTQDLRYLNHTADNVRVDNDPIQIANVKTAVELDGENARKGAEIDVAHFVYQSDTPIVSDIIDEDIQKFVRTSSDGTASTSEDDDDVMDDDGFEDDSFEEDVQGYDEFEDTPEFDGDDFEDDVVDEYVAEDDDGFMDFDGHDISDVEDDDE